MTILEGKEIDVKVIVVKPGRVLLAGAISALLVCGGVLGAMALVGVFSADTAEAYGAEGVGAKTWYFAEGYTGPGFEEWILIYNPAPEVGGSGSNATVELLFYGTDGLIGGYFADVLVGQRISINIKKLLMEKFGYSGDVSIVADGVVPFICERALYFDYKDRMPGGSQVLGYQEGASE